jgi:hypothetical protein
MESACRHLLAIGIVTFASSAFAAELPKEGNFDYTACWSGANNSISFSKTHSARSFEQTGSIRSNPPGGLFDRDTFRCVGMSASLGGKNTGTTVCESVDQDGDRRLSYFSASDGKITRETVAGTGKYDGMVLTATIQPLGPFPVIKEGTFQDCNRQTGTYKLK